MAAPKSKSGILNDKTEVASGIETELLQVAGEKPEREILTVEEKNDIMAKALRDIFDICMMFDYPKIEDLSTIAQRALRKVGSL